MKSPSNARPAAWPVLAWLTAALAGIGAPVVAMLWAVDMPSGEPRALTTGPILAVGLMAMGMITAAITGRLFIGVGLALVTGAGLILLAHAAGLPALPHPLAIGFALIIASLSFAARGSLFARSAADKGWLIAVFVVAGEVSILATALAMPEALPDWLLALLPAQWATTAIQTALVGTGTGTGVPIASSALFALAATAAATLLAAALLPRRWPYLIMFTVWLGCSALVWHQAGSPLSRAHLAISAAPAEQIAKAQDKIETTIGMAQP
ncbi:MAG: hypothetical protein ACXIT4_05130 [Erythrobacter sp.]